MSRNAQEELLGFSFADGWFLLLVPLLLLLWLLIARRRLPALGVASVALFSDLPSGWRVRLAQLPLHLSALALLALSLAIARPQKLDRIPVESEGIDILLVLDLSSTMAERDMDAGGERSRLEIAKAVARDFVQRRDGDRIGLVSFALFPDLVCPATLDHQALDRFLRPLKHKAQRSPENRTGIGAGLALAVRQLEESESPGKVVILLTDGMENVNAITPEDAAKLAKKAGVRVYTIGAGGQGAGQGLFSLARSTDFSVLREIAEATKGQFFEAGDAEALGRIFDEIDQLERVELLDRLYRAEERFLPFLLSGAGLLFLALLLRATVLLAWP
ncbi:MAG: aerotolerance regulator BatA [Planctomycetota bacterium]|nr:MAG: aerotolerance regulator BatA [Planctomycetota bacterium]